MTTPPCQGNVLWNVIKKVYPVKEKHLTQFQSQLGRQSAYDLKTTGNNRVTQPIDDQDVHIIYDSNWPQENASTLLIESEKIVVPESSNFTSRVTLGSALTVAGITAALLFIQKRG